MHGGFSLRGVFLFYKNGGWKNCSKKGAKAPILGGIIEISKQFLVTQLFNLYPIKGFGVGLKNPFQSWKKLEREIPAWLWPELGNPPVEMRGAHHHCQNLV